MANLLPPDLKREVHKEYVYRLLAVLSVHMVFGMLVVISFALSGFFDVHGNYELVKAQSEKVAGRELTDEEESLLKEFDRFRIQLDALSVSESAWPKFTDIVKVVLLGKGDDVHLESFSLAEDVSKKPALVISGVSDTRDALLAFQKHLTDNGMFLSVDLPVSNFSKKTDIDFTVKLVLASS